jgi:hypothetical protein
MFPNDKRAKSEDLALLFWFSVDSCQLSVVSCPASRASASGYHSFQIRLPNQLTN